MTPYQLQLAGEAMVALSGPAPRNWRDGLAEGLGVSRAEVDSYASGARKTSRELDARITAALQRRGREMSEPGRI